MKTKTPSLQVYYETHTAYCFSPACKTHGRSLDVIDFVMYMDSITKHEAIEKCKELAQGTAIKPVTDQLIRVAMLTKMFIYFKNAVHNSKPAQDYLKSRVFLIAVDESTEQTKRIIENQNRNAAGLTDAKKEVEIKTFLQHFISILHPCKVINPYANQIQLPEEAHKIRQLNDLFQSFVKMITILNQYQ